MANNFTTQLQTLMANDETTEAIKQLQKLLSNSPRLNEVLLQSARHTNLLQQIRLGTINFEQANLTKNKIRHGLLALIEQIEEEQNSEPLIAKEVEQAVKIIGSKNVITGGSISAGGDVQIGDRTIQTETKASQWLRLFLFLFLPVLVIAATYFWWQYQDALRPLQLKVFIENTTPNPELPEPNGTLSLIYGDKLAQQNAVNQAHSFEGIPSNFKSETLRLKYHAKGFTLIDTLIEYQDNVHLPVRRNNDLGVLQGKITDNNGQPIEEVEIAIACCKAYTNSAGFFELVIPFEHQRKEQRLDIFKEQYLPKSTTTPVLKGEIFRDFLEKK